MDEKKLELLLVEDNPGDARLLEETLQEASSVKFDITVVEQLSSALEKLENKSFDIVLLDLTLSDSQGLETCMKLHGRFPETPIIVLTGLDDEELALRALHQGAQDYLVKGTVDYKLLMRSIRYGIERKKIEKDTLRNQKLQSLEALAEGIAHDFNNMLSSVLGNISLARVSIKPTNKVYESLMLAEEAAFKAKDLTKQFLSITHGGDPIKKATSINAVLKESARTALGDSNITLQFSIPDDLWNVDVDQAQISQVITNLVIDAKESLPKGGLINITAQNLTSGSDDPITPNPGSKYVKIDFVSKLLGIHKDKSPEVHDPYFSSSKQEGGGVRLATSQSIIERHGGYIDIKLEIGSGKTTTIYLPAIAKVSKDKKKKEENLVTGKGKVLLLEDDVMVRNTVVAMLGRLGYEVEYSDSADEIVNIYLKSLNNGKPFDVVLIDLAIHGEMKGFDAIKNLKEVDEDVKGILTTGYLNNDVISNYKKHGFVEVLQKPYDLKELGKTIGSVTKD